MRHCHKYDPSERNIYSSLHQLERSRIENRLRRFDCWVSNTSCDNRPLSMHWSQVRWSSTSCAPTRARALCRPEVDCYKQHLHRGQRQSSFHTESLVLTLIFDHVRCIYRLIEFAMGIFGYLFTHEWPFYLLEASPMLIATGVFVWWYPPSYIPNSASRNGTEIRLDSTSKDGSDEPLNEFRA